MPTTSIDILQVDKRTKKAFVRLGKKCELWVDIAMLLQYGIPAAKIKRGERIEDKS